MIPAMVRTYKRKTERASTPPDIMLRAAKGVKCEHKSIRGVARDFAIPFRTLARYCKKITDEELSADNVTIRVSYASHKKVLTDDQEKELSTYLKQSADIYYGLSVKEVRKLAFQFAEYANNAIPNSWKENEMAGSDWFSGFLKRNRDLSIRSPEATSLSRGNNVARTQEVNEPTPSTSGLSKKTLTPEIIRPLPKAGPRKGNGMNKRKRFSAILTDTPVKNALQKNSKQKTHTAQRSYEKIKNTEIKACS